MALGLVLGGVRSGKSEAAERLAADQGAPVLYVATCSAGDPEMARRLERHRARRPTAWTTIETDDPGSALAGAGEATVLVDGLGGWILGLMKTEGLWTDEDVAAIDDEGEAAWCRAVEGIRAFAGVAAARSALTIVVAEEAGMGQTPLGAGARRYLDLAGESAQVLGSAADWVRLIVAGQTLDLKPVGGQPVPAELGALRWHGDSMCPPGCLDFAVNVVPGGPPDWLQEELRSSIEGLGVYPSEDEAARVIAERHGRAPGEVLALNGSAEAFSMLAAALRPRHPVCIHPSFTEPEAALRAAGLAVWRVFRNSQDFSLDPAAVPGEADLVVTCNPNNPTGNLDEAMALRALTRPGRIVVVDEAFMELSPGEPESLAMDSDLPGLLVVRSLTKVWSIPGVRAGYLLGPEEVVGALRAVRQPWSVNSVALRALAVCLRDTSTVSKVAAEVAAARQGLRADLKSLPGVMVWPSAANFLLIRVPDGPVVRAELLDRGMAVRRADTFPGLTGDHLRLAVRCPEDNRLLVRALREVLA